VSKNNGKPIIGIESLWDVVQLYDERCCLEVELFTSTASDEKANDIGEGKGGLWTNTFIARGVMPLRNLSKWK